MLHTCDYFRSFLKIGLVKEIGQQMFLCSEMCTVDRQVDP